MGDYSFPFRVLAFLQLPTNFVITILIGLVYSIYDSTEPAIQKMIEASERMIMRNSQGGKGELGE
jgi:hypothetical protein